MAKIKVEFTYYITKAKPVTVFASAKSITSFGAKGLVIDLQDEDGNYLDEISDREVMEEIEAQAIEELYVKNEEVTYE